MKTTKKLISLAFDFRDAQLWEVFADNNVYAVQLRSGEIGYCCVMGQAGEHYALGLYIGNRGWNTYLNFALMAGVDQDEMMQIANRLDCINCDYMAGSMIEPSEEAKAVLEYAKEYSKGHDSRLSLSDLMPDFVRYAPCLYPSILTEKSDVEALEDAFSASLFLAEKLKSSSMFDLGFSENGIRASDRGGQIIPLIAPKGNSFAIKMTTLPGRMPEVYPEPSFNHPELVVMLAGLPVLSNLECRQMVMASPVQNGDERYFPITILAVDGNDSHVIFTNIIKESDKAHETMVQDLALKIVNSGHRPTKIFVQDDRTELLLKDFCAKTGITMARVTKLKHLSYAWHELSAALARMP